MGVLICLGAFGGQYGDEYFQFEKPWLTIAGSLLGVTIGIYALVKDLTR